MDRHVTHRCIRGLRFPTLSFQASLLASIFYTILTVFYPSSFLLHCFIASVLGFDIYICNLCGPLPLLRFPSHNIRASLTLALFSSPLFSSFLLSFGSLIQRQSSRRSRYHVISALSVPIFPTTVTRGMPLGDTDITSRPTYCAYFSYVPSQITVLRAENMPDFNVNFSLVRSIPSL